MSAGEYEGPGFSTDEPDGATRVGLRVVGPDDESPYVMKGKKLAPTVGNAVIMIAGSKEWRGLRFNKFRGEPEILNPPKLSGFDPPDSRLDSYASAYVAHWLGRQRGLLVSDDNAHKAAEIASKAKGRSYHPVRDYLHGLDWDGERRLDGFVATYLGGERTAYTAAAWRCWMISAVARVMRPGCQVHHVPILEGEQGSGKSSAVRALLPDETWMIDSPIKVGETAGMDSIRGHWVVELAELESLSNREAGKIKAFISSAVDTFRKAYGRDTEKFPRQCVMIGTVNPEEGYLRDPTGNRRFWPLKTGNIDFKAIERDRDQLWAEAMTYYMDGASWHFEDADLISEARDEQAERTVVDPWVETIMAWVDSPLRAGIVLNGITTTDVLIGALSVPTKDHSHAHATRIGTILRRHGFVPRGRSRKYYRGNGEAR